jgi:hypothetical protein
LRNAFNKMPTFDSYYPYNNYVSPYGELRMRSYWLNVRKQF